MKKECSNSFGGDVFLRGTKNHPLSKSMVNHNQKGIKASGRGEVSDEVTRDLLERVGHRGADGGEQGNHRMSVSFVLLENCAALNICICRHKTPGQATRIQLL